MVFTIQRPFWDQKLPFWAILGGFHPPKAILGPKMVALGPKMEFWAILGHILDRLAKIISKFVFCPTKSICYYPIRFSTPQKREIKMYFPLKKPFRDHFFYFGLFFCFLARFLWEGVHKYFCRDKKIILSFFT